MREIGESTVRCRLQEHVPLLPHARTSKMRWSRRRPQPQGIASLFQCLSAPDVESSAHRREQTVPGNAVGELVNIVKNIVARFGSRILVAYRWLHFHPQCCDVGARLPHWRLSSEFAAPVSDLKEYGPGCLWIVLGITLKSV